MNEQQPQKFQLSSDQPESDASYRAISRPAIASLVLALMSPVALVLTPLIVIPAASIAVAVYALWAIRNSSQRPIGRGVAIAALFIGLVVFSIPVSEEVSYNWVVCRRARQHADTWLELIQKGQLRPAHQFAMHYELRAAEDVEDLDFLYDNNEDLQQQLQEYFAKKPISTVVDYGRIGTVNYLGLLEHLSTGKGDSVSLLYEMNYEIGGKSDSVKFKILLQRSAKFGPVAGIWQVQATAEPDEA